MAAPSTKIRFLVTQNNGGIDLCIEIGNSAVINLTLSKDELEDMLEAISMALDEDNDEDSNLHSDH